MKLHRTIQIALLAASTIWIASANTAAPGDATAPTTLSQDQIRDLIRRSADNDIQNDKKQRDYTYVERQETRKLNGKGDVKRMRIDKAVVDPAETEVLEDLIVAAANDAKTRVEAFVAGEMQKLTGGLQLPPGMKLPF